MIGRSIGRRRVASLIAIALLAAVSGQGLARAEEVPLINAATPADGWTFDNGQEFPGATGSLAADQSTTHDNQPTLHLHGDFTKGGNYVQMIHQVESTEQTKAVALWIKDPGAGAVTVRLIDGSDQCHQINFKLDATDGWQHVTFPIERFFANRGTPDAVPGVLKYENWGGANDAKWHGALKSICLLTGTSGGDKKVVDVWVSGATLSTAPAMARGGGETVSEPVSLDAAVDGETTWTSFNGQEFPGAVVHLDVVKDGFAKGTDALKLEGDFLKGGAYVDAEKNFKELDLPDLADIRLKYQTSNVKQIGVRLIDSTGQCHQGHVGGLVPDGKWRGLTFKPSDIVGGEHWGGANDGKWHGPAALMTLVVGPTATEKDPTILLADVNADVMTSATVQPPAFKEGFEAAPSIPSGWTTQGDVTIDLINGFKGRDSLLLQRTQADIEKGVSATGPTFKLVPGQWQIAAAVKGNLPSPDESYDGEVTLEELNSGGGVVDTVRVASTRKESNWTAADKRITVPRGVTDGRFVATINKTTGKFWVDELSASYLAATPRKDNRISAIMFNTAQMGNLLLPTDSKKVTVTVVAKKPLTADQMTATWTVRDYWGAEIAPSQKVTLSKKGRDGNGINYTGEIDLASLPIEQGRYYEILASLPQAGDQAFHNYTAFAVLPEAVTKKYEPWEVPFTSRDWDDRLTDYITLSDRLGIRVGDIWGGTDATPPYHPQAPELDHCVKLNMGVLSGLASGNVEGGQPGYEAFLKDDCKAIREGMKAWLDQYGKTKGLIIDLGNEPHASNPTRLAEMVQAYKAVYETVKAYDPKIMVLGTSVGPEEDFFQAGMQNYCDAYDFHIYESYNDVKRALDKYHELFKKYNCAKPIWSTELGLNAQGMSRQAVAVEMVKKAAVFFANGGANMSWFDLLWPDPEAKLADDNGTAFNVFDCRYAPRYAPKLDAVSYYNVVNAISVKKFVDHKMYDGNVDAYLFKDKNGNALQILWAEKGRTDIGLPLAGVKEVEMIAIDGRISTLNAGGKGITVTAGDDPIMLMYHTDATALADKLDAPVVTVTSAIGSVIKGDQTPLTVGLNGVSADAVSLNLPAGWTSNRTAADSTSATFSMAMPTESDARAGAIQINVKDASGNMIGQLAARYPVAGRLTLHVEPLVASGDHAGGVRLVLHNNGAQKQDVTWSAALLGQSTVDKGAYQPLTAADAYFSSAADGTANVDGNATTTIDIPMASADPLAVYRVKALATDATGRTVDVERFVAGFVAVPHVSEPIKIDGSLDEAAWKTAPVEKIDQGKQMLLMDKEAHPWGGPKDLSAKIRYLWDEKNLYIAVEVTDDVFSNPVTDDGMLWAQDGLQMLFDPARDSADKPGKYDYSFGISKAHGAMAWRHLSASAQLSTGGAKDITIAAKRATDGTGGVTYEIAIPWTSLAPFKPSAGANLGLALALNEDDGKGRHGYMSWFADIGSKVEDDVGDLVLQK
jgi:hypothetical protein